VTRILAIFALAAVCGVGAISAESSGAQLAVGVTVVRACVVDARPADPSSPPIRLTCTAGAQANVRFSESVPKPAPTVSSDDLQVVTLNF
jgi:hypothetical protein